MSCGYRDLGSRTAWGMAGGGGCACVRLYIVGEGKPTSHTSACGRSLTATPARRPREMCPRTVRQTDGHQAASGDVGDHESNPKRDAPWSSSLTVAVGTRRGGKKKRQEGACRRSLGTLDEVLVSVILLPRPRTAVFATTPAAAADVLLCASPCWKMSTTSHLWQPLLCLSVCSPSRLGVPSSTPPQSL